MSSAPWFEARQLQYAYVAESWALRNVSVSAPQSSMTALIGANGSGKSTLIRLLAGLLRPSAGSILLEGVPLGNWEPKLRARKIAYVSQTTSLAFPFQAIDVVLSGRTPHTSRFRFENPRDREIAMAALETAGAAHLAERSLTTLSGGERQMVILARALAQEPGLLLLDEPSSSLDLKHRASLVRTLARLRDERGLTVIMITHDLQWAGALFDQIVALRGGEVAAQGRPDDVLREVVLREIYDDPNVRTSKMGNQTVVWIDV